MSKSVKRIYAIFIGGVLASVLHWAVNLIFKTQEPVFFFAAILLYIAFAVLSIIAFSQYLSKDEPKDIGNLKWLGIIGLAGFLFNFPVSSMIFLMFLFLLLFFAPKHKQA